MTDSNRDDEDLDIQSRMEQREVEAVARIEEADSANRGALAALASFMKELTDAKRTLGSRPNPATSLLEARDRGRS